MTELISTRQAIVMGMIWINGAVLVGMALPWLMIGLLGTFGILERLSGEAGLVLVLALLLAALPTAWLAWSVQVPRWRVWAYRRVADIDALKSAAVAANLIWPEGHLFERTEIRSRDQIAEMSRLETVSRARQGPSVPPEMLTRPTSAGSAGKAMVLGLIMMPVSVLAPAGVLSYLGIEVTNSPIFLGLMVLFPLVLAAVIYSRARRDRVSADEAFRRLLPRGIRREDDVG